MVAVLGISAGKPSISFKAAGELNQRDLHHATFELRTHFSLLIAHPYTVRILRFRMVFRPIGKLLTKQEFSSVQAKQAANQKVQLPFHTGRRADDKQ